ncbi:hypothetical protein KBX73_07620 [Acetobacter persici]|uniref:hypothetical protein n=1 Tax=Acetobacter persici TaxID=1076596 RepID=UPI0020CC9FE7|nr:hypothetical protein [Acetobacter persici]MCP9319636.1 hypothetical protein [Acetobacter persici]
MSDFNNEIRIPEGFEEISGERLPDILAPIIKIFKGRSVINEIVDLKSTQCELDNAIDKVRETGNFSCLANLSDEAFALFTKNIQLIILNAKKSIDDETVFMIARRGIPDHVLLYRLIKGEMRSPESRH